MYIHRHIEETILKASKQYPVIMVYGQRRVGKSTMLNHIKQSNRKYVSFDDLRVRKLAEDDPILFFDTYNYPLIIDEFQKVPSILETIKDIVDKKKYDGKNNTGMFWLTGSQNFTMMKKISETLVGRIAIFEMSSLTQKEINEISTKKEFSPEIKDLKQIKINKKKNDDIYKRIFSGEMPEIVLNKKINKEKYYENYLELYLKKDILEVSQIKNFTKFYNFLIYMAARTAQEIKYDDISKQIGISVQIVHSWINILKILGVIFMIQPYSSNFTKTIIKNPKCYFMDTGLASYLCGYQDYKALKNGNLDGAFLETFVVSEIIKSYFNFGKSTRFVYFYRDKKQNEIDLLIINNENVYPIEIKKNSLPYKPDKNFFVLNKLNYLKIKPGLIICMTDKLYQYNQNCWLVPISLI